MPAQRKPAAVRPRNRQRKKVPAENRAIRPIFLHQNVNAGKNRSIIPIYPLQNIKTRKNRCICPVFSPQSAIKRENRSYTPIFSTAAVHFRRQTCLRKYAAQSLRRPSGTVWPRGQNQPPHSRGCPRPCALVPSIRRPRRMSRPLPTGSDRLPPKAACCKPVHARSPAVSGRLFWRPPPVGRQCSGVGRPCPSR